MIKEEEQDIDEKIPTMVFPTREHFYWWKKHEAIPFFKKLAKYYIYVKSAQTYIYKDGDSKTWKELDEYQFRILFSEFHKHTVYIEHPNKQTIIMDPVDEVKKYIHKVDGYGSVPNDSVMYKDKDDGRWYFNTYPLVIDLC